NRRRGHSPSLRDRKEASQRFGPSLSTRNLVAVPACVPHIADGALMTAVRSLVLLTLSVVLLAPLPDPASAETFPNHAVTVVVPFPPGGPTDALGRLVGERMGRALGQTVVIDNASGAGGTLGTAKVARAPADGYTLCVGQLNSHVFGPAVYATPYDVLG